MYILVRCIIESVSRSVHDIVHVDELANECSTLKQVFIATFSDDLAEEVQAFVEHKWGQSISLVDAALDSNLSSWLGIGIKGCSIPFI